MKLKAILLMAAALAVLTAWIFWPAAGVVLSTAALAIWRIIKRAAASAAALIRGEKGSVEGEGDVWASVNGHPSQIDVWATSEDPSAARRVKLPEGMVADQVRAVRIISGGAAIVEVLP